MCGRDALRFCLGGLLPLAVGLGGCREPEEPKQLRIGLPAELTPAYRVPTLEGAQLAVEEANAAGGLQIGGERYEVVLKVVDNEDRPEAAAAAALRLINKDRVSALVGPSRSGNAIPAAIVANAAHVPMVSPGSSHPETTAGKPYAFRVSFLDAFQGEVMARFARDDLRARTGAVLYDVAEAYSRYMAEVFRDVFTASGGEVTAFEPYMTGDVDFRESLARIRERQPEVLFLPGYTEAALLQGAQARQLGLTSTLLGVDGWTPARVAEQPDLEGSFMSASWDVAFADAYAGGRAFAEAYRRAYGRYPTSGLAALAYDAMGLLLEAARSAGTTDPEAIRDALADIEGYQGAAGVVTYRGTERDPHKSAAILTVRQGRVEFVKTVRP